MIVRIFLLTQLLIAINVIQLSIFYFLSVFICFIWSDISFIDVASEPLALKQVSELNALSNSVL